MLVINSNLKWLQGGLLFILGISLAGSLSYYKQFTTQERLVYRVELGKQTNAANTLTLDTAKQSLPKKIWQPDKVSIVAGSIKNPSDESQEISVKLLGFDDTAAELKTSGSTQMSPDGTMFLKFRPHQIMHENPKLELSLAASSNKQYIRSKGVIQFVKPDGTLLNQVPIEIINSNNKL